MFNIKYLDKYELMAEFKFANNLWGIRSVSTGLWPPGIISMV